MNTHHRASAKDPAMLMTRSKVKSPMGWWGADFERTTGQAVRSLAAQRHPSIEVKQGFSESLRQPYLSLDLVLAPAVRHHTRDLSAASAEFFRVLKPDGYLLALREQVIPRADDLDASPQAHLLHRPYGRCLAAGAVRGRHPHCQFSDRADAWAIGERSRLVASHPQGSAT